MMELGVGRDTVYVLDTHDFMEIMTASYFYRLNGIYLLMNEGGVTYQASMLPAGREVFIGLTSRGFIGFIGRHNPLPPSAIPM